MTHRTTPTVPFSSVPRRELVAEFSRVPYRTLVALLGESCRIAIRFEEVGYSGNSVKGPAQRLPPGVYPAFGDFSYPAYPAPGKIATFPASCERGRNPMVLPRR